LYVIWFCHFVKFLFDFNLFISKLLLIVSIFSLFLLAIQKQNNNIFVYSTVFKILNNSLLLWEE